MTITELDRNATGGEGEAMPPPLLGARYRLRERVGEGGMGIVYAGDHLELGTRVAIKVLQPKLAEDATARARFLREARLAASVEGEHSTRIYDVGTDEANRPYLVMEFLAGETVARRLARSKKLDPGQAATILLQLLDALAEAHAKGLVHRDLKPANLFLVDRPGEPIWVKVMDFGISKTVRPEHRSNDLPSLTEPRTLLGSPEYMSPEQLRSPDEVDRRSDIWACGVLLFELLTGTVPFEGTTLPDLYARIVSGEPRSLVAARADVPAPIVRLVERCLRKLPAERPRNAFDVATVLAPFASDSARTLLPRIRAWCAAGADDEGAPPISPRSARARSATRALVGLGTIAASGALAFGIASLRAPASGGAAPASSPMTLTPPETRPAAEPLVPPAVTAAAPTSSAAAPPAAIRVPEVAASSRPTRKPTPRAKPTDLDGIELLP